MRYKQIKRGESQVNGKYLEHVLAMETKRVSHTYSENSYQVCFFQEEEPIDFIEDDTPGEDKSSILLKDEDNP